MIKAVLFDMDGTLLDINLTAFMTSYAADVSRIFSAISGRSALSFSVPLVRGYLALASVRRRDDLTNLELFFREFERLTGVPVGDPVISDALTCYERDVLPLRGGGVVAARPMEGGLEALERVDDLGLTCALATNPSFSENCIKARMRWARIDDAPFARVSHMGNSTRLKPTARYYEEFVGALGLAPEECLMVGNDARRDFPHPDVGLRTIYVGHARPRRAVWSGHMRDLARELPAIVELCNVEDQASAE